MGWGDDLMVAGEARRIHRLTGKVVSIVSHVGGASHWSPLWNGLTYIAAPGQIGGVTIIDSPQHRPYRAAVSPIGSTWREYNPQPSEILFSDREIEFARQVGNGFIVIEPHVKLERDGAENKQWGFENYRKLVQTMANVKWIQLSRSHLMSLPGVTHVRTNSFRQACAILAQASAYVGPEGGLHHASAAVGIPAVVIFGGYISPQVTGYSHHKNLFRGTGLGCGRHLKCECSCMLNISIDEVANALVSILAKSSRVARTVDPSGNSVVPSTCLADCCPAIPQSEN
jgi:Glycosyltransferase family 9 (heptosyltransferase)